MKLFKIINKEAEYLETINRVYQLKNSIEGSAEYEEFEFLQVLIRDYEYRKLRVPVLE
jgi:hypothetical protein